MKSFAIWLAEGPAVRFCNAEMRRVRNRMCESEEKCQFNPRSPGANTNPSSEEPALNTLQL